MEQYKAVFLLGVPGSGKGTHGRLLERMSNHLRFLLLDGLPRNETQIQLIKPFINVKQVIDLFVPKSVARERLKKRSLAEGSADDSDEIKILKRMKTYYEKTFPLR